MFDSFTTSKLFIASLGLLGFSIKLLLSKSKPSANKVPEWLFGLVILYCLVILAAWLMSDVPFIRGAFGQFGRGNGPFFYFFTALIFIYSIITIGANGKGRANRLIAYFSWFMVIYASLQKIGIDIADLDTKGISSIVLTFGNSNFAGGMLSVLFTYHLIYAIQSKEVRIETIFLLISLLGSSTFAASVQGYLIISFSIALGISMYILQRTKSPWVLKALILSWILGFFTVIFGAMGKFLLAEVFARNTFQARIEYWHISTNILKDNLLFGFGPDKMYDISSNYMSPGSLKILTSTRMDNAHNWFLNLAANYGLLALLALMLILGSVFVCGFLLFRQENLPDSFTVASFAAFSAMFIDGLVSIEQPGIGVWLYFFGGVTIGSYLESRDDWSPKLQIRHSSFWQSTKVLRYAIVFMYVGALLFSTIVISSRVIQDVSLRKSVQAQLLGQGTQSTLESIERHSVALKAEPEYAVQALQSLAAVGDALRIDRVSEATYSYYPSSIQATLIRADVLGALGRGGESCPLRGSLIRNTPWDYYQLELYLFCLTNGFQDLESAVALKIAANYIPANDFSELPETDGELSALNNRLGKFAVSARLNLLIGNQKQADLEQAYAIKLLPRILELERKFVVKPIQPARNNYLTLLRF